MEELQMKWGCLSALMLLTCQGGDGKGSRLRLEGSLSQVMNVGFDSARIFVSPKDVALEFIRQRRVDGLDGSVVDPTGVNEDTTLSIAFPWTGGRISGGTRIDLNPTDGGTTQGVCTRNVFGDPRRTFPTVVRGSIFFGGSLEPGSTVRGDFNVTFDNGVEAASGRTAFSSYEATVQ
jgi:hypothetical protein